MKHNMQGCAEALA